MNALGMKRERDAVEAVDWSEQSVQVSRHCWKNGKRVTVVRRGGWALATFRGQPSWNYEAIN